MEEALLREIARDHLLPLFSGASLEDDVIQSSAREKLVSFIEPQVIAFKVNKNDEYRLKFRRNQPFAGANDPARERQVIDAFVSIVAQMEEQLAGPLKDDLLSTFQRKVVAEAVSDQQQKGVLEIVDQMAQWANRLYEGAPIASAIGISPDDGGATDIDLATFGRNDFGAVLSNGFDTLLEFDNELGFVGHHVLSHGAQKARYCPWRNIAIADWTEVLSRRIALVLNRLGEILVFRGGQLLFARRSGQWHFLTHDPILRQMAVPQNQNIRKAVYETALDASFARTGACLGVVRSDAMAKYRKVVVVDDQLSKVSSAKSRALSEIVNGRKFHDLDRTLRQELVAIDGATVIDHEGAVLAVGAILKIEGGSTGGGRMAAAKQLGKLGLGVKISQDGGISGFRPVPSSEYNEVHLAFQVM